MNKKDQRIAIAEACGWNCDPDEASGWESRGQWVKPPEEFPYVWPYKKGDIVSKNVHLPDYLNDLNACHDFEKVLSKSQRLVYLRHLTQLEFYGRFATATQRAEAFLKTLNLWEP